jgi:1-deoxyxylulose-5-phosphate synthase
MKEILKRKLGSSDLMVSEVSLGSWLTYSGGVGREQAEACTRAAYEMGINFFDTANVYGRGASETAWGEILSSYPRDSYILATKVYFPMSDTDKGLSAEQIKKQIDLSLQRLKTDYVDLYQCHRFDIDTPIEETMEALTEVVRSGKARYIGFSEWTPEQIEAGLAGVGAGGAGVEKFVSSQPVGRFRKFQRSVLGAKAERVDTDEVDIKNYVKYLLMEGTILEKREMLACLKSRLIFKDKRVVIEEKNE